MFVVIDVAIIWKMLLLGLKFTRVQPGKSSLRIPSFLSIFYVFFVCLFALVGKIEHENYLFDFFLRHGQHFSYGVFCVGGWKKAKVD